jgi:hypothetical protein
MLQLYHKDGSDSRKPVISEKYDEFLFHSPGIELQDALGTNPIEVQDQLNPNDAYSIFLLIVDAKFENEELKRYQEVHEKILADYEIRKLDVARLEEELHQLQQEIREMIK